MCHVLDIGVLSAKNPSRALLSNVSVRLVVVRVDL
jgi:hypothetical protein